MIAVIVEKVAGPRMKNHGFLNIDRIAFIGRTYAEYIRMFDLDKPASRITVREALAYE